MVDLAAEVEDVDVARGELRRDVGAAVGLARGDEDGERLQAGEPGGEVLGGGVRAGEAGHGAGSRVVAGDRDVALAADDDADVVGHVRAPWLVGWLWLV